MKKDRERREKLPNFFIVGAAKSGTTSLYHHLCQHLDVFMSPVKEPHYFSRDVGVRSFKADDTKSIFANLRGYIDFILKSRFYILNFEKYKRLFSNVKNEKAIGEASVSYLVSKVAAEEIYKFNPDAKIIIILRNPVKRAFSHWLMDLRIGHVSNPIIAE